MKQNDKKHLTAENGRPIADNQNTQTAGVKGVVTLQDPWLTEKLAHFDREVIPERRMHAKGSGAYGTFTVTHDISAYTRASIFAEVGKQTPCFVRFSTVAGERGAADAERDIRGFAMKFYTDTGNWDLVGNNTPVFFLRLSGCNLQCPFCDTNHQGYREMSEDEIVQEASQYEPRHIVITGGEPAMQLTQSLLDKLHEAGFFIQVETNGTMPLPEGIDWVTCSPKGQPVLESVDELKVLYEGNGTDLSIADDISAKEYRLQPLDTGDDMRNRMILRDTISYIMQHPRWSLSLQTHKLLGIK